MACSIDRSIARSTAILIDRCLDKPIDVQSIACSRSNIKATAELSPGMETSIVQRRLFFFGDCLTPHVNGCFVQQGVDGIVNLTQQRLHRAGCTIAAYQQMYPPSPRGYAKVAKRCPYYLKGRIFPNCDSTKNNETPFHPMFVHTTLTQGKKWDDKSLAQHWMCLTVPGFDQKTLFASKKSMPPKFQECDTI